jgi:CNT family concentrative nucleoside transporter
MCRFISLSGIIILLVFAWLLSPHKKTINWRLIIWGFALQLVFAVLAIYIFTLKGHFPMIAGHLVSASFLSAPAALITSKILLPETGRPKTLAQNVKPHYEKEDNMFSAIINGANSGVKLIVGIVALLIAVISLVELVDMLLGWIGGWFGTQDLSLKMILG